MDWISSHSKRCRDSSRPTRNSFRKASSRDPWNAFLPYSEQLLWLSYDKFSVACYQLGPTLRKIVVSMVNYTERKCIKSRRGKRL